MSRKQASGGIWTRDLILTTDALYPWATEAFWAPDAPQGGVKQGQFTKFRIRSQALFIIFFDFFYTFLQTSDIQQAKI